MSDLYSTKIQPDPLPGDKVVLDHVISDLITRAYAGKQIYGTFLMTNNGRDALVDAYQEALDLCMYLKQALLERDEQLEKSKQLWADGQYIVEIKDGVWYSTIKEDK